MDTTDIKIRNANKCDSAIIAKAIAMGIGDENAMRAYCGENYLSLLAEIAKSEFSQYSYRNAFIAEVNNTPVGAAIGYDGALLHELRAVTYSIIRKRLGRTPSIPDETEGGEFYLDTVAVLPEYRGLGIGRRLVSSICKKAFSAGHEHVGLIVDHDNPRAESLYTSMGFKRVGTKSFLGHRMWHLQKDRSL